MSLSSADGQSLLQHWPYQLCDDNHDPAASAARLHRRLHVLVGAVDQPVGVHGGRLQPCSMGLFVPRPAQREWLGLRSGDFAVRHPDNYDQHDGGTVRTLLHHHYDHEHHDGRVQHWAV